MTRRDRSRPLELPLRALWLGLLLAHLALAALAERDAPGGFPQGHLKFWANQVFPAALLAAAGAGALAALLGRRLPLLLFSAGLGPLWLCAALAGRVLFPASLEALFLAPLGLGAFALVLWVMARSGATRMPRAARVACFLLGLAGAALGAALALAQRSPDPETRPLAQEMPSIPVAPQPPASLPVAGAPQVQARAALSVPCGRRELEIEPLLRFFGRSPDRFWVRAPRQRPHLVPVAVRRDGEAAQVEYSGTLERFLSVAPEGRGLLVEGWARLEAPFYSHLNAFATFRLRGAANPALAFSPAPQRAIEVLPAELPRGAPQRQAWLEPDGTFRVTAASNADKGPFRTLAAGALGPEEPLAITFLDGPTPLCRVTLDDFARQASRGLSPTAGWGAPVNAVEFSLLSSEARIDVTLAGTSVGRGLDSTGHAAGVYRNRLHVQPLP
jgi:hypothetical protein